MAESSERFILPSMSQPESPLAIGSGVPRALEAWPDIEFQDDRNGTLFVATVRRKTLGPGDLAVEGSAPKTTQKTTQKILALISEDPGVTRQQLAEALGITSDGVKYHLSRLQEQGLLRRIGPDKGGRWKVGAE